MNYVFHIYHKQKFCILVSKTKIQKAMKHITSLLMAGVFLLIASCSISQNTVQTKATAAVNRSAELKAISNLLEQYITANENEDLSLVEDIWAPDADIILIGTTKGSFLMGWNNILNAFKKQYDELDNIYITASEQYVKLNRSGNTAWFAEILDYNYMKDGKAKSLKGIRFTGVVQKCDDGKWRFVQTHLSIPVESD